MYELTTDDRKGIVDEILRLLPGRDHDDTRRTIEDLADKFEGQDINTVGLLYRAAEAGKFDDYARKLDDYYEKEGQNIPVGERCYARNKDLRILRDIDQKETEIEAGTRPREHRSYWPLEIQGLARHLGSVKMELFFASCFQEVMKK